MQKKFKLAVGAGIVATFDGPLESILGTTALQKMAILHVMEGGILRFDAIKGSDVLERGITKEGVTRAAGMASWTSAGSPPTSGRSSASRRP